MCIDFARDICTICHMNEPQFRCWHPRPAHLDLAPLDRMIYQQLKDMMGHYRTRGVAVATLRTLLGVKDLSDEEITDSLASLVDGGFAEEPTRGLWRMKR